MIIVFLKKKQILIDFPLSKCRSCLYRRSYCPCFLSSSVWRPFDFDRFHFIFDHGPHSDISFMAILSYESVHYLISMNQKLSKMLLTEKYLRVSNLLSFILFSCKDSLCFRVICSVADRLGICLFCHFLCPHLDFLYDLFSTCRIGYEIIFVPIDHYFGTYIKLFIPLFVSSIEFFIVGIEFRILF